MKFIITFSLLVTFSLYMVSSYVSSATNRDINAVAEVILKGIY